MIHALGWVAAALGIISALPQLLRILRTRSSAGVSVRLWQLNIATGAAWATHGYLVDGVQMQLPNVALTLAALFILGFALRESGLPIWGYLILPAVLAAALICVDLLFGAMIFGFAIAAPQLVGQVAQFRVLLRASDLTGVSGGYLALFLLVQVLWFSFGLMSSEWALVVCAGAMVIVCAVNLVCYFIRSTMLRRPAAVDLVA